jgi:hypothetical protein
MSLRPAVDILARTHTTRSPPDRSLAISDDLPSLQWRDGATYVRRQWEILSLVCGSECELGLADAMGHAVSRKQGQEKMKRRVHETTLRAISTLGGGHAMSRDCPVGHSELKRDRGPEGKLTGMGRRRATRTTVSVFARRAPNTLSVRHLPKPSGPRRPHPTPRLSSCLVAIVYGESECWN